MPTPLLYGILMKVVEQEYSGIYRVMGINLSVRMERRPLSVSVEGKLANIWGAMKEKR